MHKRISVQRRERTPILLDKANTKCPLAILWRGNKNRQKLVKLADSTDLGWRVVQEYESKPLADDSDDEKKMIQSSIESRAKVQGRENQAKRCTISPIRTGVNQQNAPKFRARSPPPPGLPRTHGQADASPMEETGIGRGNARRKRKTQN